MNTVTNATSVQAAHAIMKTASESRRILMTHAKPFRRLDDASFFSNGASSNVEKEVASRTGRRCKWPPPGGDDCIAHCTGFRTV